MTDVPDARLLEQFARNGSEDAFAALVQRHIALVHSVALRRTANPQHAEDITQAVFVILARKSASRPGNHAGGLCHLRPQGEKAVAERRADRLALPHGGMGFAETFNIQRPTSNASAKQEPLDVRC